MLVQNQISGLKNHKTAVQESLGAADEILLMVAYVREKGVNMILDCLKGKPTKVLCSFDMGITQLSGVRKLIDQGAEVRVYRSTTGTFHPKVWLFKSRDRWQALVGSANLTSSALTSNVEVSALLGEQDDIDGAVKLFHYLWESQCSVEVTEESVAHLQAQIEKRMSEREALPPLQQANDDEKIEFMFDFVKGWIDIPKFKQKGISSLWRGWFIIPDHGYVNDNLILNLAQYVFMVGDRMEMNARHPSEDYAALLKEFVKRSAFQRENLQMQPHDLFVRQAKNYLMKLGWVCHPLRESGGKYVQEKRVLLSTDLGKQVADCRNDLSAIKSLYSEYFEGYSCGGLRVVEFVRRLLGQFGYLDLNEFNYFVTHAYSEDDFGVIARLISGYRDCTDKAKLDKQIRDYFTKVKEPTANSVYGNYLKNVKHTMSAIAWCSGFSMSETEFVIRKTDSES